MHTNICNVEHTYKDHIKNPLTMFPVMVVRWLLIEQPTTNYDHRSYIKKCVFIISETIIERYPTLILFPIR